MNVKSKFQLIDYIDNDLSRRKKEIINFKNNSLTFRGRDQNTYFKQGICLAYSHWEGFIKHSSIAFFQHLKKNGYKYNQLKNNFKVCAVLTHFDGKYGHQNFKSMYSILESEIDFNQTINIDFGRYIDTKSNLKTEVLIEILSKLGISSTSFSLRKGFIDEILLAQRNAIAHGEYRDISKVDFENIINDTINLLDIFHSELCNHIATDAFLNTTI